uniref:Platelet-derived growth factor (PDGF) family profile domain-containing protein n=1 Tax=Strigamia maritima TaxID=126957 RepID=T1JBQ5_STRMM
MGATGGAQTAALLLATFFMGHVTRTQHVDNNESHQGEDESGVAALDSNQFIQLLKPNKIAWDTELKTPEKKIPLDLLKRLSEIESYDELMSKLIEPGRRFVTRSFRSNPNILAATGTRQLKLGLTNTTNSKDIGRIFDKRAFCRPRRVPVHVPQPTDPMLIYQPMCIQIERCGGCCAHELFECVPSLLRNATRKVVALRYPHAGAEYFEFEKVTTIKIQRHARCKCQCKVQPEDCSAHQVFQKTLKKKKNHLGHFKGWRKLFTYKISDGVNPLSAKQLNICKIDQQSGEYISFFNHPRLQYGVSEIANANVQKLMNAAPERILTLAPAVYIFSAIRLHT